MEFPRRKNVISPIYTPSRVHSSNKSIKPSEILKTFTSQNSLKSLKSGQSSRTLALSPSQLESRERLRQLRSQKSQRKISQQKINEYQESLNAILDKKAQKQLKKFENNAIFSPELNQLRQETLKEVKLHRQVSLYAKQVIFQDCHRVDCFDESQKADREIEKQNMRKSLLERFEVEMTHLVSKPIVIQTEDDVKKKNLAEYFNSILLKPDDIKIYDVKPVTKVKLSLRKYLL